MSFAFCANELDADAHRFVACPLDAEAPLPERGLAIGLEPLRGGDSGAFSVAAGGGELWAALDCARAFACFNFDELGDDIEPSAAANRATAARWASTPSPERPCSPVLTRK